MLANSNQRHGGQQPAFGDVLMLKKELLHIHHLHSQSINNTAVYWKVQREHTMQG